MVSQPLVPASGPTLCKDVQGCRRRRTDARRRLQVFSHVCQKIGLVSDRRLGQLISYLDPDGSGRIRYEEFMEIIGENGTVSQVSPPNAQLIVRPSPPNTPHAARRFSFPALHPLAC